MRVLGGGGIVRVLCGWGLMWFGCFLRLEVTNKLDREVKLLLWLSGCVNGHYRVALGVTCLLRSFM